MAARSIWKGSLKLGSTRLDYWLLPGQRLSDVLPQEVSMPDLEEWLAPLREQFPSPTPLDEE